MSNQPRFEVFPELGDFPGDPHRDFVPTGNYRWRLRAANGQISAVSGEGFTTETDAERAVGDFARDLGTVLEKSVQMRRVLVTEREVVEAEVGKAPDRSDDQDGE